MLEALEPSGRLLMEEVELEAALEDLSWNEGGANADEGCCDQREQGANCVL